MGKDDLIELITFSNNGANSREDLDEEEEEEEPFISGSNEIQVVNKNKKTWVKVLKILMISSTLIIILILLATVLNDLGLIDNLLNNNSNHTTVLDNKESNEFIENMKSAMNEKIDPCDDFYAYACGGWLDNNTLGPNEMRISKSFGSITKSNSFAIQKIIDNNWPIIGDIFKSCKKMHEFDELDCLNGNCDNEFYENLEEVIKSLRLIEDQDNVLDLLLLELKFKIDNGIKIDSLFSYFINVDELNPEQFILEYNQADLILPGVNYYNRFDLISHMEYKNWIEEFLKDCYTYLKKFEGIILIDEIHYNFTKVNCEIASEIFSLEKDLATISYNSTYRRKPELTFNRYSKYNDDIDNSTLLKEYTMAIKQMINQDLNIDDFIIREYFYFISLNDTIEKYSKENIYILKEYIKLKLLIRTLPKITNSFSTYFSKLQYLIYGVINDEDYETICSSQTNDLVPFLIAKYLIENDREGLNKNEVSEMISSIEEEMKVLVNSSDWMDKNTKTNALKKIEYISNKIANPETWEDYQQLYYNYNFIISPTSFYHNYFNIKSINYIEEILQLNSKVDKNKWFSSPDIVNAWYNPVFNQITFPFSILKKPFYNNNYPFSLNYGGIGTVIGHEITHGFDDNGRMYDYNGVLNNWWSIKSENNFITKSQCYIEQYSSFQLNGNQVNGELTLGENIADNNGILISFNAMLNQKKQLSQSQIEKDLINFQLTHEEIFFIAYAQNWCSKQTPKYENFLINTDVHSPSVFRVLGVLKNSDQFQNTFKCKKNQKYFTEKKCAIWEK